jgi:ABC-type nitrate/sulfonate/bicarbonate transport system substrate-binding protein
MKPLLAGTILAGCLVCAVRGAETIVFRPDWFPGPQFAGFYAADELGYYRDAGLRVEFVPFKFGARPVESIAQSTECSLGTLEGYIFLGKIGRPERVQALAAVLQESPAGYLSLAPTRIASARDFAGRRVGVHKFGDPLFHWFLRRAGMSEDAAQMSFVGGDLAVLTGGQVDVLQGYATEELVRLRQSQGDRAEFISFRELGFDSYSEIIFTTGNQLEKHRAAIAAFLHATRRGWAEIFAQPDEARAILRRRIGTGFDETFARQALAALRPYVIRGDSLPLAPLDAEKWRRMEATGAEMGLLPAVRPVEEFLPADLMASAPP